MSCSFRLACLGCLYGIRVSYRDLLCARARTNGDDWRVRHNFCDTLPGSRQQDEPAAFVKTRGTAIARLLRGAHSFTAHGHRVLSWGNQCLYGILTSRSLHRSFPLHGFLIKILPASATPQTCWGSQRSLRALPENSSH